MHHTEQKNGKHEIKQIQGIYKLELPTGLGVGPVNVFLVEAEALTLIDAGMNTKEAWNSFQEQLKQIGYEPADIEQVILTHHHADHVGLLEKLRAESNFKLYGHARNEPWINPTEEFITHRDQFYAALYQEMGVPQSFTERAVKSRHASDKQAIHVPLDGKLQEGDQVPSMSGWTVIETPGHAQSQIGLFRQADGMFIGGDHIIGHISSNALIEPPALNEAERPKCLIQYRHSLEKCLSYDISVVLAGHGGEVTKIDELIPRRLKKQDERAATIKRFLQQEALTCFEVCKRLFPIVYQKQTGLTLSETLGHLDLLVHRGEIQTTKNQTGTLHYQVAQASE